MKVIDGTESLSLLGNCGWTTNFILVPSGYRFSIIGLTTYPIFVLGLLNGNSPKIEPSYEYNKKCISTIRKERSLLTSYRLYHVVKCLQITIMQRRPSFNDCYIFIQSCLTLLLKIILKSVIVLLKARFLNFFRTYSTI